MSLSDLPVSLIEIDLSHNELSGNICEEKISDSLNELFANHCKFTGSFVYENLPKERKFIDLSYNQMSGSLRFGALARQEGIQLS